MKANLHRLLKWRFGPKKGEVPDVPEEQKTCPCCKEQMSPFGHESCEQLHDIPAWLEVHETQRLGYACGHCHGAVVRAQPPVLPTPDEFATLSSAPAGGRAL